MRLDALVTLVRRDVARTRGPLATAGFGIAAGTAALVFFLALGLGVRAALLGNLFRLDQVELEPPKRSDPGLLALVLGDASAPGISNAAVTTIAKVPGVAHVYPKLRFAFPASAHGGAEIIGHEIGTSEMLGDGVEPALVAADVTGPFRFDDPMAHPGAACANDDACAAPQYCERPSGAAAGRCSDPVPVLVSRYLVELFNRAIAPAHHLPPVGETLLSRANGVTFSLRVGESLLGRARSGSARTLRARVVGISPRAIDLGVTLPLEVVRRLNREYAGERAATEYSSVLVETSDSDRTSAVLAEGARLGLEPHDTRARDVSVLVTSVIALLSLVAAVLLTVAASNIAYTFRVLVGERRAEIGLYRAVGASASDMRGWMLALAATVGVAAGALGVLVARVAALAADWVASTKLPDFPFKPDSFFAFPAWLYAAGIAFAALFALLGAFPPARRAAKTDPAEALGRGV